MIPTIDDRPGYWYSRFAFERSLALVYLIAFLCAANQFIPLLGEHGLLPVPQFVRAIPFGASPSLFYLAPTDAAFRAAAWAGIALACLALSGVAQHHGAAAVAVWTGLWVLYLSFVNVGQTFYAFGWESLLLEAGFLTIFAGSRAFAPSALSIWMWRWVLFRIMFGAGLIKLRGDPCWRDLTCLDDHEWFTPLLQKLLEGDPATLSLLKTNPFPTRPPVYVRARYYAYRFTTREERRRTGRWWNREPVGLYFPPARLQKAEPPG